MIWGKLLLLSLVLFIGSTKALRKRIINGRDVKIENYPYQVSLRQYKGHLCGGSIISERHILTAAHCIIDGMVPPYKNFFVVSGTSRRLSPGIEHEIANVTIHPDYWVSPDQRWAVKDIAVITLKNPIVFNESQQKVSIPQNNYVVGLKANATGWGYVDEKHQILADQLQMMEMKVISKEECQKSLSDPEKIAIFESHVCGSHDARTNLCFGDSGGALVINGEVIGVTSWIDGETCETGYPAVFTNVYKFQDFIRVAMKQTS